PDLGDSDLGESFDQTPIRDVSATRDEIPDLGDSDLGESFDQTPISDVSATRDENEAELEEGAETEATSTTIESNPEEIPSETNNQSQSRPIDPFADFPRYIGEIPYVCGVQIARIDRRTRRTSDSINDVQAYFEEKLADTDFQVEKLTDEPDTKVYRVSKGNLTKFLQLFAVKEQGTMILLSYRRDDCYRLSSKQQEEPTTEEEQITKEEPTTESEQITEEEPTTESEQITEEEPNTEEEQITEEESNTEQKPTTEEEPTTESEQITEEKPTTESEQGFDAKLTQLFTELNWTEEEDFVETSEVEIILEKDTKNSPEELALLVINKLKSEGFEASKVKDETSGLLYEIKKGEFTKYISFVPTK
ncbi:MAG: hypothetical protein AAF915_29300, partial [Cyanobacteria bacterium P01_D01_bin.50]